VLNHGKIADKSFFFFFLVVVVMMVVVLGNEPRATKLHFQTDRNSEIINVCYFKLFILGIILYRAINN
jgi:hypothetical protein